MARATAPLRMRSPISPSLRSARSDPPCCAPSSARPMRCAACSAGSPKSARATAAEDAYRLGHHIPKALAARAASPPAERHQAAVAGQRVPRAPIARLSDGERVAVDLREEIAAVADVFTRRDRPERRFGSVRRGARRRASRASGPASSPTCRSPGPTTSGIDTNPRAYEVALRRFLATARCVARSVRGARRAPSSGRVEIGIASTRRWPMSAPASRLKLMTTYPIAGGRQGLAATRRASKRARPSVLERSLPRGLEPRRGRGRR